VHFSGAELNGPLAQALADKVLAALAKRQQRIQGGRKPKPVPPPNAW